MANTPDEFDLSARIGDGLTLRNGPEFFLTNKGLRIDLELAIVEANVYLWLLYCTDYFKDEWQCIYLIAVGKDVYARALPQKSILRPRTSLTTVRRPSQYLIEEVNSKMSSIVIKSGLDRSFAFPNLQHENRGYQPDGTYPEHLWHPDHGAFLQVGHSSFAGFHVLKLGPRHSAVILAFGVTDGGRCWLCFVTSTTAWKLTQKMRSTMEWLQKMGPTIEWLQIPFVRPPKQVMTDITGEVAEYGIFRNQKQDRLPITWNMFVTAELAEYVQDGCTRYVVELGEENV